MSDRALLEQILLELRQLKRDVSRICDTLSVPPGECEAFVQKYLEDRGNHFSE